MAILEAVHYFTTWE